MRGGGVFMFNEFDFQIDNFMMHCDSKNLSRKTKKSYEQTLRLFSIYLRKEHTITDPLEVPQPPQTWPPQLLFLISAQILKLGGLGR